MIGWRNGWRDEWGDGLKFGGKDRVVGWIDSLVHG